MKTKLIRLFYSLFFFCILIQGATAEVGGGNLGTWYGYVIVDSAVVVSDNTTVVSAYINSSSILVGNTTVGAAICELSNCAGFYYINVQASVGDNITFKVNGVNVSQAQQQFSAGTNSPLNLSMNKTANGVACTYNNGCISGYCVDGYCCNSACDGACNFCNVSASHGTCTDVDTECSGTDSSCYCSSGSCVACSSGYACSSYSCVASGGSPGGGGAATTIKEDEIDEEEETAEEDETPAVCIESWSCTGWSGCFNDVQTRTCTDANACGTFGSRPSESQECFSSAAPEATPAEPIIPLGVGIGLAVIGAASIVITFIIFRKKLKIKKRQNLRDVL